MARTFDIRIVEQRDPHTSYPFRLIEIHPTIEGPRTRILGGVFPTLEEARKARDILIEEADK